MAKHLCVTLLLFAPLFVRAQRPPLSGRVRVVERGGQFRVRIVQHHPDLRVRLVQGGPHAEGLWQLVDAHEDFTVQLVDAHPGIPSGFSRLRPQR